VCVKTMHNIKKKKKNTAETTTVFASPAMLEPERALASSCNDVSAKLDNDITVNAIQYIQTLPY
jgi:hypothetical protein